MNKSQNSLKLVWIFLALNFCIGITAIVFNFQAHTKICYIDSIELLKNYKGMENVKLQLDEYSRDWKNNLDTLKTEIDHTIQNLEKNKGQIAQRAVLQIEESIKLKQQQFFNYQNVVEEKYKKSYWTNFLSK